MDIGKPLSQLASQHPISTGCDPLDLQLEGGFKAGCIYEIYGPPGSCKEVVLSNVLANGNSSDTAGNKGPKNLVIQTHKPVFYPRLGKNDNSNTYTTRITKFSQLLRFLQVRESQNTLNYGVLIIDDFAQLLVDHANFSRTNALSSTMATAGNANANGDYTTKRLNLLLSLLTKYANKHNTIIFLVDHCIVTQREYSPNSLSSPNPLKKGFLTSALEWGNALNGKNAIGAKLLKLRLGFFWDWDSVNLNNGSHTNRKLTIVVLQGCIPCRSEGIWETGITATVTISCEDANMLALNPNQSQLQWQAHGKGEVTEPGTIQESQ